jgi:hypothetical protein
VRDAKRLASHLRSNACHERGDIFNAKQQNGSLLTSSAANRSKAAPCGWDRRVEATFQPLAPRCEWVSCFGVVYRGHMGQGAAIALASPGNPRSLPSFPRGETRLW